MKNKVLSSVVAFVAAASILTGSAYADGSILLALNKSVVSERTETGSYTTPMTNSTTSARYKAFVSAKPANLRSSYDRWGESTLAWDPVKDAVLYYVYRKDGSSFKLVARTVNCFYQELNNWSYVVPTGTYYVRAVTYNYNDKRIMSAKSDKYTVNEKPVYYYDDYDAVEEDADTAIEYEDDGDFNAGAYPVPTNSVAESEDGLSYISEEPYDPYAEPLNEEYSHYDVDGFKKASDTPLSTFSADVDTASYANVRRLATDGNRITEDAVRIEEMLNYFDYNYVQPSKSTFSLTYEYSDCPWNKDAKLLMLGLQAKDLAKEPASNLVFLVDVSGSMYSKDKLPLLVESFKKLMNETTSNDRISIVTYSGFEKAVISGARGNMKNCIGDIADALYADGSTNGEAGINMAYEIAKKNYIKNGSNRVILATDGDLNVGISDKDELSKFIAEKRDTGVYLTVLGFGTGNIKDNKMEALAKDGNGNYHYIDCAAEATKVLVDERKKTLVTVADDVKIQVEFNPTIVDSYKLIGYDGRKLNNEDFTNDKKDAADMGAGQSITVLYEIIPAKKAANTLTYQTSKNNTTDVCTMKVRFKKPGQSKSLQSKYTVKAKEYLKYSKTGIKFRFATCVAEAAMALKGDETYGDVSLENAKKRFGKLASSELKTIGYSDDFASLLELLRS